MSNRIVIPNIRDFRMQVADNNLVLTRIHPHTNENRRTKKDLDIKIRLINGEIIHYVRRY